MSVREILDALSRIFGGKHYQSSTPTQSTLTNVPHPLRHTPTSRVAPPRPAPRASRSDMSTLDTPGTSIHQIVNPEGGIYSVDTISPSSQFYGKGWDSICHSFNQGEFVEAIVESEKRRKDDDEFVGWMVRVGRVLCFMPVRCAAYPRPRIDERIIVRVKEFDPNRQNVIVRELPTTREAGVDDAATALRQMEDALHTRKTIEGVPIGEDIDMKGQLKGFYIAVNGLIAFMPKPCDDEIIRLVTEAGQASAPVPLCVVKRNDERMQYRVHHVNNTHPRGSREWSSAKRGKKRS